MSGALGTLGGHWGAYWLLCRALGGQQWGSGGTDGTENTWENSRGTEGMGRHLGGYWGHWGYDGGTVGQYFVCWGWTLETRG